MSAITLLVTHHAQQKSDGVLKAITNGGDALNVAITEVRRISRDLRPSALDDLGLSPALKSLSSEFSMRTGVEIEVSTITARLPKHLLRKEFTSP